MWLSSANLRQFFSWAELISDIRFVFRPGDVVRNVTNISMKENIKFHKLKVTQTSSKLGMLPALGTYLGYHALI